MIEPQRYVMIFASRLVVVLFGSSVRTFRQPCVLLRDVSALPTGLSM